METRTIKVGKDSIFISGKREQQLSRVTLIANHSMLGMYKMPGFLTIISANFLYITYATNMMLEDCNGHHCTRNEKSLTNGFWQMTTRKSTAF